jgi:hypothetical protein
MTMMPAPGQSHDSANIAGPGPADADVTKGASRRRDGAIPALAQSGEKQYLRVMHGPLISALATSLIRSRHDGARSGRVHLTSAAAEAKSPAMAAARSG